MEETRRALVQGKFTGKFMLKAVTEDIYQLYQVGPNGRLDPIWEEQMTPNGVKRVPFEGTDSQIAEAISQLQMDWMDWE